MIGARIEETAEIEKAAPNLKVAAAYPPDLKWPCLRGFLFFKDEDPTKPDHIRVREWRMEQLQEVFCNMGKEYSRAASRLAIPQLLNEINVLRQPQQAERRFRLMNLDPNRCWTIMKKTEGDNKDPLERCFEQVLHLGETESRV